MTLPDAQREMRSVYLDGAVGTFVSSALWILVIGAALVAGLWTALRYGAF